MEPDSIRLLIRQIKDIQSQANRIVAGESSDEAIESFVKYSNELKNYIQAKIKNEQILSYINELPEIEIEKTKLKLWQYFVLPSWWISLYKEYQQKNEIIEEINFVKGKYATLELLLKGLA